MHLKRKIQPTFPSHIIASHRDRSVLMPCKQCVITDSSLECDAVPQCTDVVLKFKHYAGILIRKSISLPSEGQGYKRSSGRTLDVGCFFTSSSLSCNKSGKISRIRFLPLFGSTHRLIRSLKLCGPKDLHSQCLPGCVFAFGPQHE